MQVGADLDTFAAEAFAERDEPAMIAIALEWEKHALSLWKDAQDGENIVASKEKRRKSKMWLAMTDWAMQVATGVGWAFLKPVEGPEATTEPSD